MIDADEDEREPWDDLSEEQTQEEQYELTIQVIEVLFILWQFILYPFTYPYFNTFSLYFRKRLKK